MVSEFTILQRVQLLYLQFAFICIRKKHEKRLHFKKYKSIKLSSRDSIVYVD